MRNAHQKNTVRYYLILIAFLSFVFFSSDFGLIDVQKTAIVMAVGVDREEDSFIVTSQIAVPQSSKQGSSTETVQIVSRGKTVADAFEEINEKTGWYPKLVFCKLIILGEKTAQQNVFDALDFFLLDEYLTDNCLLATCDGLAKDLLNTPALVDSSGSLAMQKVLSSHAERVGTVMPSTLREFAIGYYSSSKYGFLPVLKTQQQQEKIGKEDSSGQSGSSGQGQGGSSGESGGSSGSSGQGGSGGSSGSSGSSGQGSSSSDGQSGSGGQSGKQSDKPVFSASETALFVNGKRVDTLTEEQTFALGAVKSDLRLASYSVPLEDNQTCTLSIKRNDKKNKFKIGKDGRAVLKIRVTLTSGFLDYSKALPLDQTRDSGDVPKGAFGAAEKLLSAQITSVFEKCRACGCDVFELRDSLQKHAYSRYDELKDTVLENALVDVSVRFQSVR